MRKLISVITLIVMTSVNVMYPFTYADSLGDNFEEIQNFDETMQDDGDFSDEENTEDEENEDDESDLQEEQNDEEDENTAEEENENSDEEYEDDEEENTDETADNAENKDKEDIENDENNEEQSEKNNENDENTNEEDEDDDNSAIDLLKDLVEGSGNILSGEVLDFTGENLELTGEVIELTGEALELSIARETLNTNPIIGTENTKGVTVNVEAQSGTFPEGTELKIKPITVKKELNEIKEQIIDSQENVSENSELVAFDISFIYTLSGGNEVEVQPKNGEGVKVTFDYTDNETLSKADNNDEQEVKVFHIDDKDANGEKVEKGEEVVKDVTNKRESEEDGIAVADAETFSVYAVVTTTVNGVKVTYNLRGGYWVEDLSQNPKEITYTLVNGKYTANTTYRTPSKTGYMFMGWFDESLTTRRNGNVTDDMNVYAKWQEFGDLDIYIVKNNSTRTHYTFMDRNMGATELYNKVHCDYAHRNDNSCTSLRNYASYGYYYQRGNNYGFDSYYENNGSLKDNYFTSQQNLSTYTWDKPYSSPKFVKISSNDWINPKNSGLWGGNENDVSHKQGPCPDGYHVPSADNRNIINNTWVAGNYRSVIDSFHKDFLLPSASYRKRDTTKVITDDFFHFRYLTSTFGSSVNLFGDNYLSNGTFVDFRIMGDKSANGFSIRCLKNVENPSSIAFDINNIDLRGGEKAIISVLSSGEVVSLQEPIRNTNDEFRGWYKTSDYSGSPIEIGSTLQQGDSLYARWCADGLIDDGSQCINAYTVTFDSNGGSSVSIQYVTSGETGTKPEDPTKDGYQFSGWYLTGLQTEFDFNTPITSNITIYAKWTPIEYTISYELNGGEVAISNPITYTIETQDFTLHNPTRVGYDFLGWSGTNLPGCSVEEHSTCSGTVSIQQGSTGNRVFEAIWDAEKYNLNFDSFGGSEVPTQRIVYGETGTRPVDPTKDGYEFSGWYLTGLETEFDFDNPITSNITIYAKWTLKTYTISYELNGGEVATSNPTTYTKESSEIILNNPSRDWYIFEGWSGTDLPGCSIEDTSTCNKNVTIPHGSTGDRTYEAIWGYVKYDLNFDSLGGSEVPTQRVIHGETGTKPADPTKDGYSFEGWYWTGLETPFNFTGTAITGDITVYAKWNLVNYNITYNLDGGTGLVNTGVYTVETQDFTLNNPTKLNYIFIGWSGTDLPECSVEDQTTCNKNVSITQGSIGDRVYDAIFDCAYGRKLDGTCNIVRRTDGLIDYNNWEYNDLEVDLSITDPVKIVIMDRNLGAAVSGTGNNENAYGFYYQWGNNYGFSSIGELDNIGSDQVDASAFGPGNYYVGNTFIKNGLGWDSSSNYNLWGGTGDVFSKRGAGDDEARQGPCPNGYHIPSVNEGRKLTDLVISWKESGIATNLCSNFSSLNDCVIEKLRLTKPGNYDWQDGLKLVGQVGRYWTSSRLNQGNAYRIALTAAGGLYIGQNADTQYYSISNGMSVRCFKDVSSKPIVYELRGGVQKSNQTSTVVWWNEGAGKTLTIPTKTGFIFDGWYLTSGYEEGTRVTKNVISDYSDNESVTLYAKWKDPQYKTITYNANGGYFSGGLISTGIVFKEEITSGNYVALTNVQFPNREGYMFDGWYLTGGETEWIGYVDNSTEEQTVYAKWLGFNDLTLTMSGITFTIMDRNLGATDYATGYTYGITNEQNSQSRRGKYYQWGNNYGFLSSGNPSSNVIINNTDDFGPGNYFSNATFIWNGGSQNGIWGNTNNNLWGGQYISSGDETRQGPCPVNYHVPTKNEWDKAINLFNTWKNTEEGNAYCNSLVNSGDKYCFSARLGLPFPGYRIGQNGFKFEDNTIPTYRSSSPTGESNKSYRIRIDNMNTESLRNGYGVVVRCFKNTEKRALSFESKGGEIAKAPTETVRWWETTTALPEPTRSNSIFSGWYTTSGYVEGSKVAINYIESDKNEITLYAKWECEDGYEEAADGRSCIKKGYTVTITSNNEDFGRVASGSVAAQNGASITTNGNELTIGDVKVTAIATGNTQQYSYKFSGWNNNCGNTLTGNCTIVAQFNRTVNEYTITFYTNGGLPVPPTQTKQYGLTGTKPADPTKIGYTFSGWFTDDETFSNEFNFSTPITDNISLYAKWTPITYNITYELNGGYLSGGATNPETYTIKTATFTLNNPTKIGYDFLGWSGTDLPECSVEEHSTCSETVSIQQGSTGNRKYTAIWQARDDIIVTINYNFQDLNPYTNKLEKTYTLSGTETSLETADATITLSDYALNFDGYIYDYGEVNGEKTETTTVLPNGNRVIDLYYTRNKYDFDLVTDPNSTTAGTSSTGQYYYGAKITLSGDVNSDCFMWSGWNVDGVVLENNTNQTSFYMPANNVTVESSVTEKTYNIIFDGNDETSGEMEAINGIRCTESRQLPLNTFKKTGYTFSGWTTEPNGEKKYNDRATIQTLTTGNGITLEFIAVWDINKYEVVWKNYNGDVLDTQELPYLDIPEYKGGTAPSRPADAQYTYTFAGWTPEYTGVTGPQVYTAVYTTTLNEYTITWNIDGTETKETYKYGETPSYKGFPHRDPTPQYEYTFAGWSPSITGVKEDATYTAQFNETLRTYTIRWENHNGDELERDENVPYGEIPEYNGAIPTRTGDAQHSYIFAGWSPETGMVVKDQTYTAIYHSNQNTYTIIWKNEDGTVLETDEDVPYGATPEYNGATPSKESDAQYDYIFAGWTPATGMVVGDKTYIATYTPTLRKYTVTWKNSDGSVIKTDTGVEYGSTPEYKGSTPTSGGNDEFEYTFIGWNPTVGEIHGDTTYTALYEHNKRKYTVIWENGDGTVLRSGDVEYGETPTHGDISPTKTGDAQYSYRFIGWDPEISAVTGNITYVPKFESILNRYSITFVNDNGSTLKESIEYDYGTPRDEIAKPENTPTKASDAQYHYTFAGWSPATGMVVKDQIYTATYTTTLRDYTVTWKNEDGTVLETDLNVPYGTTPTYNGATPTKPSTAQYSYAFIGWDPALSEVKGDVTYTAKFSNVTEVYTITWEDEDGTELEKDENVPYGATPEYNGATPTKASDAQYDYTFAGWAPETGTVVGDQVYSATYIRVVRKYTVTWKNEDGTVLERDLNVPYGATPEYNGATPTKTGNAQYSYTFDRWTPTVDTVEGDMTYTATYNEIINKYTVTWENRDGTPLKIDEDVPYGTTQVYDGDTPTKEGDAQYSYTFNGWDKDVLEILEDTTYTATYTQTVNKYTIRFVDEDGTQLQSSELEYGTMPAYNGATPTKAATAQYTYTFDKWTPTLTGVTGPQVYTATYTQTVNKYTIKFVNEDGTELQSSEVEYGTTPAYNGSTPVKTGNAQYTYTFDKWTPTLTGVTGPQVYTATYTQTVNKYTIKFVNEDGTELQSSEVAYGVMPAYTGETPTKAATAKYTYTFDRWTPTLTGVTGPQVYTATYTQTINKYTITWKDGDGNTLKTEQIHYGQTPEYSGVTPTKAATAQYTYTFNNTWSPAIQSVTENATYTAQFDSTVNKYLITFVDGDGKTIQTGMVEYGDTPSYVGTTPTKTATAQYTYTFNNTWNPTITGVTENATYKAQFDSTVNKYTVTWKNDDGTELEKDENVPYGTMPSYDGSTPIKSGEGSGNYEFIGWNPTPSAIVGNTEYTAKYKDKRVPEDNGGQRRSGGGGRKHTTSQSEETDQHGSAEDSDKQSESEKEVFDAYKRAYKYGITTMDTEKRADPDGYVTRGHLAKMVVNFAVNVLGRDMPVDTPTQCKRTDKNSEWESNEIKFYAEKACALGVMGIYTEEFMPNKIVDRAEFGTVVSRLLWGNTYDELDTDHHLYFTKHLKALQESGFMKDVDNPLGRKEYRKRVWVTLKRVELEKDKLKKES